MIDEVGAELRRVCEEAGVGGREVSGREKSPFSIWEKMQRRNVQFEQLSDIMAFRIVVPTRADCYAALGAIHAAYPVIAGRFKDYISTPSRTAIKASHRVTLREPRNQKIEVQIRTAEMHLIAETASPRTGSTSSRAPPRTRPGNTAGSRTLLEILDNSSPEEFLENTKLELYKDEVFCFTQKGQLIQLPRGATPVDFAYAVHSQVGDSCVGARVNGRILPLKHEPAERRPGRDHDGEGHTPNPQWERFVVTGKARARIRRYVLQQQRQEYRDNGRAALAKAFRHDGLDGSEKALEPALKALKQTSLDDLYVAVGNNNLGVKEVIQAVYPEMRQVSNPPRMLPTMAHRGTKPGSRHQLPISGLVSGMDIHYAGCCHPVAGDRIVGIVATGKGVTIHTRQCPTLERFRRDPRALHRRGLGTVGLRGPRQGRRPDRTG